VQKAPSTPSDEEIEGVSLNLDVEEIKKVKQSKKPILSMREGR
jgi:hypothetical protein